MSNPVSTLKQICKLCQAYMQYHADQTFPYHPHRYFKCSCGYTVETGEYKPKAEPMISLNDYITSSGKYPERAKHVELTEEVRKNATILLELVNVLLVDLNVENVKVSSGFRPSDVNSKVPGAAKGSLHKVGMAIDLEDAEGSIDELIAKHPEMLDKYGLWLENPASTNGWSHLDNGTRPARKIRIFHP